MEALLDVPEKIDEFLSWSISAQTAISDKKWVSIFSRSVFDGYYSFFSINLVTYSKVSVTLSDT